MLFSELMAYYDYKFSNVARGLNLSRQAILLWKKKNRIPYERQCQIEIMTNGQLKADILMPKQARGNHE